MSKLVAILTAGALLWVAGCSSFRVLFFDADEKLSGQIKGQTFSVTYVRPSRMVDEGTDTKYRRLFEARIPNEILAKCGVKDEEVMPFVGPALLPFIIAFAQIAFDAIAGAIDSKRKELKRAAVQPYDATVVVDSLLLRLRPYPTGEIDGQKIYTRDCVISQRFAEVEDADGKKVNKPAMTLVHVAERYPPRPADVEEEPDAKGLTFTPAYLRVDLAAAQTAKVKDGKPKISMTGTLAVSAVQFKPKPDRDEVALINTAPFSFSGIEIGVEYINPKFVGGSVSETEDTKILKTKSGPLFVPLQNTPALGTVSVAIIERGSAAGLDDASAAEKSMRTAIRSAIGQSVKALLSE